MHDHEPKTEQAEDWHEMKTQEELLPTGLMRIHVDFLGFEDPTPADWGEASKWIKDVGEYFERRSKQ